MYRPGIDRPENGLGLRAADSLQSPFSLLLGYHIAISRQRTRLHDGNSEGLSVSASHVSRAPCVQFNNGNPAAGLRFAC